MQNSPQGSSFCGVLQNTTVTAPPIKYEQLHWTAKCSHSLGPTDSRSIGMPQLPPRRLDLAGTHVLFQIWASWDCSSRAQKAVPRLKQVKGENWMVKPFYLNEGHKESPKGLTCCGIAVQRALFSAVACCTPHWQVQNKFWPGPRFCHQIVTSL